MGLVLGSSRSVLSAERHAQCASLTGLWNFPDNDTLLIDFSIPEAVQGTADMVAGFIEKLNLKIYRQDFNTNPCPIGASTTRKAAGA